MNGLKKKSLFFGIAILFLCISFLPIFKNGILNNLSVTANGSLSVDYRKSIPTNAAKSAIVIDAKSKSVLFESNADEKRGMASTTKIMTALVVIENSDPEYEFTIPKEAVGIEGSSVYLKEGEKLTVRELLYCLMLESGNDAAVALAICCGESVEGFAEMMNARAEEMGLTSTHFTNPHGLSDENHYTTARELAIITAEAMQYPLFREIVSTKRMQVRYNNAENGRTLINHNKLLFGYEGATGVKTGYTSADGKCLVSSAERENLHLIAVTLQDPFPTSTHRTLLDAGFAQFEQKTIAWDGQLRSVISVENGEKQFLNVCNVGDVSICVPKDVEIRIELQLPKAIQAPVEQGEIIGKAVCICGEDEVYIINIESQETIKEKKKSLWQKIFGE